MWFKAWGVSLAIPTVIYKSGAAGTAQHCFGLDYTIAYTRVSLISYFSLYSSNQVTWVCLFCWYFWTVLYFFWFPRLLTWYILLEFCQKPLFSLHPSSIILISELYWITCVLLLWQELMSVGLLFVSQLNKWHIDLNNVLVTEVVKTTYLGYWTLAIPTLCQLNWNCFERAHEPLCFS